MLRLKREKDPRLEAAVRLRDWAVARARAPVLYTEMGVPDTVEGRFEALTLHMLLLLDRLQTGVPAEAALRQRLFDEYIGYLDGAMREMGVGDLAMGKRMRKLGEAIYGRAKACDLAFASLPDHAALEAFIARTVLTGAAPDAAAALARYLVDCRARLAARPLSDFIDGLAAHPEGIAP